jgi:hypothetical protein
MPASILTDAKLGVDKKAKLGFEEKKKKKKEMTAENTVLTPTRRQKPTHKSPTAAGMRKYKRSVQAKKSIRSSIK